MHPSRWKKKNPADKEYMLDCFSTPLDAQLNTVRTAGPASPAVVKSHGLYHRWNPVLSLSTDSVSRVYTTCFIGEQLLCNRVALRATLLNFVGN